MEIRVEHAASGETFDHAQLLNPQQHQSRPDIVEKLDSDEQNPERNPVILTLGCERNTVMSNKHELEFLKTVGDAVSVPPILLGSKLLPLQIAVYYEGRNCHRRVSSQARKRKRTARAGAESCPDLAERKPCDRSRADNHPRARRHHRRSLEKDIEGSDRCRA